MRILTLFLATTLAVPAFASNHVEPAEEDTTEETTEETSTEETAEQVEEAAEKASEAAGEAAGEATEEAPPPVEESTSTTSDQDVTSLSGTNEAIGELQPSNIDILSIEPAVNDAQREAFARTAAELQRSIETANVATDNAKTRVRNRTKEVQVAKG